MSAIERLQSLGIDLIVALPGLIVGIITFVIFYVLSRPVKSSVVLLVRRSRRTVYVSLLMGRLAHTAFLIFGLLVALTIALPSFQPAQLISLLGIASVAIGFAFRDILLDVVSGILLLLTSPFEIGDEIEFNGDEGIIEEIHTSFTYVRTHDNRRLVIPNGDLFTNPFMVETAFEKRRSEFDISIHYDANVERAQAIILDVLEKTPGVLDKPEPDTLVTQITENAQVIRVRWWTYPKRSNVLGVQNTVLRAIKQALAAEDFIQPADRIALDQARIAIEKE